MQITLPNLSLIILIGPSSAGKSTFARAHFKPSEVISSDMCRALVADDENVLDAHIDTFDLLHYIVAKRLKRGLLTVVDATNVHPESRAEYIRLAREYYVQVVAIVFNLPEQLLQERNLERTDRDMGAHVIRNQRLAMRRSLRDLRQEGFRKVYYLDNPETVDAATIVRVPPVTDRGFDHGPFDFIGDIHGCIDELLLLLQKLGYQVEKLADRREQYGYQVTPPEGRKVVFVGDLVDRGPGSNEVLRLAMSMVGAGHALAVPGNHDDKLLRYLNGRNVKLQHGLEKTVEQFKGEPPAFHEAVADFIDRLPSHYVLDDGRLVVAHAGLRADMQNRAGRTVRSFCLYGETSGEMDEFGLPVRFPWARDYDGRANVVYGHTPVPAPEWVNRTINIDTGCVFGGRLTALRYPERELVSVPAAQVYSESRRPFTPPDPTVEYDLVDARAVMGRLTLETRLRGPITIPEANAAAALETMGRYSTDPRWLVYLPPTMAPVESSTLTNFLEHPAEAFAYYAEAGVSRVVCEEKHMGSRAVVVIGRTNEAIRGRFGIDSLAAGHVFTRTGRAFFDEPRLEADLLERLRRAMTAAGFWEEHQTDWALFDCELMPWSAKAQALLTEQYAAVGAAGRLSLSVAREAAARARDRGVEVGELVDQLTEQRENIDRFCTAYGHYCWPVRGVEDLQLAPFHLLATENAVHTEKPHTWHLEQIAAICKRDEAVLLMTNYRIVDLMNEEQVREATEWWLSMTEDGGEGMVVKPLDFIVRNERGVVQPALKVRGREYLRIIYGPDYLRADNLRRLKERRVRHKRSLAVRELALGIEALERFAGREPLRRVHPFIFGIAALEHEPVDPAL